jgi:2-polyprenyl-3-methyl-5-hydroxy-6-metoxy-1,4-benzoquinol methylase
MTQTATALKTPSPADAQTQTVYPRREAADERQTLHANDALSFDALSHFGWGGKRDLRAGARILVVGEGNGDATVSLAEQARGTQVGIVAIDISEVAIALSKARLAQRGLTNVIHHQLSLLDLPQAELGEFDIIECSNVLDHIENPLEGLAALGAVLADDGLMALTLNANYGRLQVYMIQALMQHLVSDYMPREMKIQIVREFVAAVPPDHWLGHDSADFVKEIEIMDGSGIEALFLQPHNHTFTVGEIYQVLDMCGLALTSFMGRDRAQYKILTHTQSPMLLDLLKDKPEYEREVIADLMHAGIRRHQFYASIEDKTPAAFADDMVITFAPSVASMEDVSSLITQSTHSAALLKAIDGKRTIGEIVAQAGEGARAELEQIYNELNLHQKAFLRHKDITPNLNNSEIQARLKTIQPITYQ